MLPTEQWPNISSKEIQIVERGGTYCQEMCSNLRVKELSLAGHSFACYASPRPASSQRLGFPQRAAHPVQQPWHSRMSALSRQSLLQSSRFRQALRHICCWPRGVGHSKYCLEFFRDWFCQNGQVNCRFPSLLVWRHNDGFQELWYKTPSLEFQMFR